MQLLFLEIEPAKSSTSRQWSGMKRSRQIERSGAEAKTNSNCHPESLFSGTKLRRVAGVSEAGACSRNPEREAEGAASHLALSILQCSWPIPLRFLGFRHLPFSAPLRLRVKIALARH